MRELKPFFNYCFVLIENLKNIVFEEYKIYLIGIKAVQARQAHKSCSLKFDTKKSLIRKLGILAADFIVSRLQSAILSTTVTTSSIPSGKPSMECCVAKTGLPNDSASNTFILSPPPNLIGLKQHQPSCRTMMEP